MKVPEGFILEHSHGWNIARQPALPVDVVLAILKGTSTEQPLPIKETRKARVFLVSTHHQGRQCSFCVKHYRPRSIFAASRAAATVHAADRLHRLGIKTAPVPAAAWRTCGLLSREYFVIMDDISQFEGLPEYVEQRFSLPMSPKKSVRKRMLIKQFAQYIRQLHDSGIYQADFKATNIFVEERGKEAWDFRLIDLDRVSFCQALTSQQIIKNLAQINTSIPWMMTLADRLRFCYYYLKKGALQGPDKQMVKKVILLSEKRNPRWHPRFRLGAKAIRAWQ